MDLHTVGGSQRLIGNIVIEPDLPVSPRDSGSTTDTRSAGSAFSHPGGTRPSAFRTLVGFENHSGRTYLGSGVAPLGRVLRGYGNNGEDNTEGARYQNAHGCYMHGSLLPKNPHLADHLLSLALQRRYGTGTTLPALDDALELHAHGVMVERLVN